MGLNAGTLRGATQTSQVRHARKPPTIEDKVTFLRSGAPWPGEPPPECRETHAAYVFLTCTRAWKLKKPVRLVHVDQRKLASRSHLCHEELRLNRELSGDIYRSVTPLVQKVDGSLSLGGDGKVVDWLVESERLPATAMLDHRLAAGPPPDATDIEALCDVLVDFYLRQPKDTGAADVFLERLLEDSRTASSHLAEMAEASGAHLRADVLAFAEPQIQAAQDEIRARGAVGLIVEGHGDLRAEHVCLTLPIVVFDRMEVDHGVRLVDPFYEVNGLGIECALLGAGWARAVLLQHLSCALPPPSSGLLRLYGVLSSLTRARLAADHFRDRPVQKPAKWRARTARYLLAATGLIDSNRPT